MKEIELCLEEILQEEEAERAYIHSVGKRGLPPFLFQKPEHQRVVLRCRQGKEQAGFAFGVVESESSCFFLHHISLSREYAKKGILQWFLQSVFNWTAKKYQIKKVMIEIRQPDAGEAYLTEYLKRIKGFEIKENCCIYQAVLPTEKFKEFRRKHWYCPQLLEKKGYEAVGASKIPKDEWEKIRKAEERGSMECDYLSPGFWEKNMKFDPQTTYVLVKKGSTTPLGWIITENKGNGNVLLRRFYIYKEERKKRLGPAFSTRVLDEIEKYYKYLNYEVIQGNRQMEMFLRCYCQPYLLVNDCKCKIILERTQDQ